MSAATGGIVAIATTVMMGVILTVMAEWEIIFAIHRGILVKQRRKRSLEIGVSLGAFSIEASSKIEQRSRRFKRTAERRWEWNGWEDETKKDPDEWKKERGWRRCASTHSIQRTFWSEWTPGALRWSLRRAVLSASDHSRLAARGAGEEAGRDWGRWYRGTPAGHPT